MEVIQVAVNALVALTVAATGWYVTNNLRMQARVRLLELRVSSYRSLFALTEVASPTRAGRNDGLSDDEAKELGRQIYHWYYQDGNGLLMPNETRQMLQSLQQRLQGEAEVSQSTDPVLRDLSQLRAALRRDVGIFASHELGREFPTRRWRLPWRRRHQ